MLVRVAQRQEENKTLIRRCPLNSMDPVLGRIKVDSGSWDKDIYDSSL